MRGFPMVHPLFLKLLHYFLPSFMFFFLSTFFYIFHSIHILFFENHLTILFAVVILFFIGLLPLVCYLLCVPENLCITFLVLVNWSPLFYFMEEVSFWGSTLLVRWSVPPLLRFCFIDLSVGCFVFCCWFYYNT